MHGNMVFSTHYILGTPQQSGGFLVCSVNHILRVCRQNSSIKDLRFNLAHFGMISIFLHSTLVRYHVTCTQYSSVPCDLYTVQFGTMLLVHSTVRYHVAFTQYSSVPCNLYTEQFGTM